MEKIIFKNIIFEHKDINIEGYINYFTGINIISEKIIDDLELNYLKFNYNIQELINKLNTKKNIIINYFDNNLDILIKNLTNVEYLIINSHHLNNNNKITINKLPYNIKVLVLNCQLANKLTKDILPIELKEIQLGDNYNFDLDDLPIKLETLIINCYITCKLDNLPSNLKTIKLSSNSNKNIDLNNLPDSIEFIIIRPNHNIKFVKFPKNLKKIFIGHPKNYYDTTKYIYNEEIKELCNRHNIYLSIK